MKARDRVKESTTTTGTGSITLAGAVAKFRTFSAAGYSGDTLLYLIEHQTANEWEIGIGTVATSTLVRTSILYSSAGTGVAQNFSAGTKHVSAVHSAQSGLTFWPDTGLSPPDVQAAGGVAAGPGAFVSSAATYGVSIGQQASVSSLGAIALGYLSQVQSSADYGIALNGARVTHKYAVACGSGAVSRGYGSRTRNVATPISSFNPRQQDMDAQWMTYTTSSGSQVMTLAGQSSQHLVVPIKTLWTYDILLQAFEQGGSYRAWSKRFLGSISRGTGDVAKVPGYVETEIGADTGFTVSATLTASTSLEAPVLTVTGLASTNILWSALGRIIEGVSDV